MKFKDIIFYNRGAGNSDGNNYWKKYRTPHYIYVFVMLVLMGLGIGLVSLFVCSSYLGIEDWGMFISYLKAPLVLILNIAPCVLLVLFFYFATGRAWAAFTFPALIVFVLSLINYYKIRIRSEAFIASDFSLVNEMTGILPNYTLEITGRVVLTVCAFAFGVLFAVLLMRGGMKNKWVRIIGSVAVAIIMAVLYATVYISPSVYNAADNSEHINRWSELQVYVSKGFLYPFINSVPDAFPTPPDGYDKEEAAQSLAQYTESTIPDDKKVNIISVMFEAYSDLSRFDEINLTYDLYAPLHQLEEESLSGSIIPNVFGGGTVDTERNFLTSYTVNENYRAAANSNVWYLKSQDYTAEGLHAGDGWFYNRENIDGYLGFDNYYFLEDFENSNRTDEFFFSTLKDLYDARDKDVPYFNFSVTYQNHGAYDDTSTCDTAYVERGSLSEGSYNILNNYLSGVADTTERMLAFVDSFRDSEEPVVIVFFGDHMPWMGDGNSVLNELGINLDLGTEDGFYNYYTTPYIIWANAAAKETLGADFTGDGGRISSCFLMGKLFDECGWDGSAFMQMSKELCGYTNIVNTATGLYCQDGVLTKDLTGAAAEIAEKLEMAEYYMKHEFMYGELNGG